MSPSTGHPTTKWLAPVDGYTMQWLHNAVVEQGDCNILVHIRFICASKWYRQCIHHKKGRQFSCTYSYITRNTYKNKNKVCEQNVSKNFPNGVVQRWLYLSSNHSLHFSGSWWVSLLVHKQRWRFVNHFVQWWVMQCQHSPDENEGINLSRFNKSMIFYAFFCDKSKIHTMLFIEVWYFSFQVYYEEHTLMDRKKIKFKGKANWV